MPLPCLALLQQPLLLPAASAEGRTAVQVEAGDTQGALPLQACCGKSAFL